MGFKREGAVFTLSGRLLKLVDKFTYLSSNISSTESDVNIWQAKAWTTIILDKKVIKEVWRQRCLGNYSSHRKILLCSLKWNCGIQNESKEMNNRKKTTRESKQSSSSKKDLQIPVKKNCNIFVTKSVIA